METVEKIFFLFLLFQGACCREFSISLPEKIEALSGSCVIINCTFEIEDKYDNDLTDRATGGWYKDGTHLNNNLVFNSDTSSQNSFIKGNIIGKLKDKNCTTVFHELKSNHSGQYYFRIEGEGGLKWTYAKKHVSIQVMESPPKPRVKNQVEVLEGSSVSLRCSAETLCSSPPPTLTWSSTPRIPLSESSRLQELISDLNFTATHREHRVTFTCTITYQLQDRNKTAQDSITLHVQYAPKISNSSCVSGDVTVCSCEADGNPSPELGWYLSGRPVTNSSNTFISEERLSSTGLRSSITLHQSLTHTSTLQCVSNNTRGTDKQLFQLLSCVAYLNIFSVFIGVAVGALVVTTICLITFTCVRKENMTCLQTRSEGAARNISNDGSAPHENEAMMSSAATAKPDSIIYSSIVFTKSKSREVESVSSPHAVYPVVQDCSGGLSKTESSTGESSRAREAQVIVRADVQPKQRESKQSEEDFSQLYAKVKHRNP